MRLELEVQGHGNGEVEILHREWDLGKPGNERAPAVLVAKPGHSRAVPQERCTLRISIARTARYAVRVETCAVEPERRVRLARFSSASILNSTKMNIASRPATTSRSAANQRSSTDV
jgi:hypothetical protein